MGDQPRTSLSPPTQKAYKSQPRSDSSHSHATGRADLLARTLRIFLNRTVPLRHPIAMCGCRAKAYQLGWFAGSLFTLCFFVFLALAGDADPFQILDQIMVGAFMNVREALMDQSETIPFSPASCSTQSLITTPREPASQQEGSSPPSRCVSNVLHCEVYCF